MEVVVLMAYDISYLTDVLKLIQSTAKLDPQTVIHNVILLPSNAMLMWYMLRPFFCVSHKFDVSSNGSID